MGRTHLQTGGGCRRAIHIGKPSFHVPTTQKGFTMVELLVVLGIAVAITAIIVAVIVTLIRLSPPSQEHAIALRQIQNAGQWLTLDINMASKVEKPEGGNSPLIKLTQPRWDETEQKLVDTTVTYRMDGDKLLRGEQAAGEETVRTTTVAENVELAVYLPDDTDRPECCVQPGGTEPAPAFCIQISCEVGGIGGTNVVKRCYQVTPRVAQQETGTQ